MLRLPLEITFQNGKKTRWQTTARTSTSSSISRLQAAFCITFMQTVCFNSTSYRVISTMLRNRTTLIKCRGACRTVSLWMVTMRARLRSVRYQVRYALRHISKNLLPDWMMFSAATVFDNSTRNSMVSQVHGYAS